MSSEQLDIRKAIADVELIRRVLDQVESNHSKSHAVDLFGVTLSANLVVQGLAFASAALLLLTELISGAYLSRALMLGATLPDLRIVGIGLIAAILLGLVVFLYLVIWKAARESGEEFNAYIVRNFRYARLLSYLSDLLIKFLAVALVIWAGHPEWVAPLLTLFTGDYLVQGRLFTLPTRTAVFLGAAAIAVGLAQFFVGNSTLLIPLLIFVGITGISLGRLFSLRRAQNG